MQAVYAAFPRPHVTHPNQELPCFTNSNPAPLPTCSCSNPSAAAAAAAQSDPDEHASEKDADAQRSEFISLRQRAAPFLEMLRRSAEGGHDVVWGA